MIEVFNRALTQYGVKEIPGTNNNPHILEYFRVAGHRWVQDDELAWCSAFVNWCARVEYYESTGKLNARSWLDVGLEVNTPETGDLVIFWRVKKDSPYGHVGFYVNDLSGYIYTLGGNQGNMVKISSYPEYRLLGFRRLRKKRLNGEKEFFEVVK